MPTNVKPGTTCQDASPLCIDDGTLCRQASQLPVSVGWSGTGSSFGTTRILPVPYYTQPKGDQCQSTVLRMYAEYLERSVVCKKTGAGTREIPDIWKDINTGTERPEKVENHHTNMMWWLGKYFTPLTFGKVTTTNASHALLTMINSINKGFPLMASVTHSTNRTTGHIILVIGYEKYRPDVCMADDTMSYAPAVDVTKIVVHDPYGAFDPSLGSKLWKKERWTGGQSLASGGEKAPGTAVRLPVQSVKRAGAGQGFDRSGNFELMTVTG